MTDDDGKVLRDILVHVGETRKGMKTLEGDVKGIRGHLRDLNHSSVRKDECTRRHVVVASSVDSVKSELKQDLSEIKADVRAIKTRTGDDHPALTPQMLGDTSPGFEPEASTVEETKAKGLKYWLGVLTASITIFGFLGAILWGVFRVGRYMERVDQAIIKSAKSQQKLQTTMQQAAKKPPHIIYVRGSLTDAGPPPTLPKRPPRRKRAPVYRP
jgi:hypothetical protein